MTIPDLLKLLFSTFPPAPSDDAEAQLTAYAMSLDGHDVRDVEAAVRKLIRGEVAGHNPSFAPSAALLGSTVRQCLHDRLDAERREGLRRPALPPPEIERSPESQARVRAKLEVALQQLASSMLTDDAAGYRAQLRKTNERFDAERGFAVGDPVQDEAAA